MGLEIEEVVDAVNERYPNTVSDTVIDAAVYMMLVLHPDAEYINMSNLVANINALVDSCHLHHHCYSGGLKT